MKQVLATIALLSLSSTWDWAAARNPGQQDQKTGQQDEGFLLDEDEPLVAPPEPVRVVGQAQTKEEFDAWTAIDQTEDLQQKAELAMDFLEFHPKSGLTPLAHQLLALYFQQQNEYEKFVDHGEKAIAELPSSYVLLIELAVGYAERGEVQKALSRAQQGLDGAAAAQQPGQMSLIDYMMQVDKAGLTVPVYVEVSRQLSERPGFDSWAAAEYCFRKLDDARTKAARGCDDSGQED